MKLFNKNIIVRCLLGFFLFQSSLVVCNTGYLIPLLQSPRLVAPVIFKQGPRHFGTLATFIAKRLTNHATIKMIKKLQKNPEEKKIVMHIFGQQILLKSSAAFGFTHLTGSNFSTGVLLQTLALGWAISSTKNKYEKFLESQLIKQELYKIEAQIESTKKELGKKIETTHEQLHDDIISTQTLLSQRMQDTEKHLDTHIETAKIALLTQLGTTEQKILSHLNLQSAVTHCQLEQLLKNYKEFNDNQKRILEIILKTPHFSSFNKLARFLPFESRLS